MNKLVDKLVVYHISIITQYLCKQFYHIHCVINCGKQLSTNINLYLNNTIYKLVVTNITSFNLVYNSCILIMC